MLAPVFDGRHARKTITSAIAQLSSRFSAAASGGMVESRVVRPLFDVVLIASTGEVWPLAGSNERRVHAATGVLPWSELGPHAGTF